MLEAMAHGCAIVATPVGGNPDAVRDGDSALLVPPGDVTRLAVALQRVIGEPELRAALQTRARQRWLEGFDIASHCRRLATLYRELCPSLEVEAPWVPFETAAEERPPQSGNSPFYQN
jgi:glycosyltransferase involved in cell wall biosynthesis